MCLCYLGSKPSIPPVKCCTVFRDSMGLHMIRRSKVGSRVDLGGHVLGALLTMNPYVPPYRHEISYAVRKYISCDFGQHGVVSLFGIFEGEELPATPLANHAHIY